jgi:hypothetical protein
MKQNQVDIHLWKFWKKETETVSDLKKNSTKLISVAGTRTRVFRVRAEYPDQLDYNRLLLANAYVDYYSYKFLSTKIKSKYS